VIDAARCVQQDQTGPKKNHGPHAGSILYGPNDEKHKSPNREKSRRSVQETPHRILHSADSHSFHDANATAPRTVLGRAVVDWN
jgi:hypothetical protein